MWSIERHLRLKSTLGGAYLLLDVCVICICDVRGKEGEGGLRRIEWALNCRSSKNRARNEWLAESFCQDKLFRKCIKWIEQVNWVVSKGEMALRQWLSHIQCLDAGVSLLWIPFGRQRDSRVTTTSHLCLYFSKCKQRSPVAHFNRRIPPEKYIDIWQIANVCFHGFAMSTHTNSRTLRWKR